MSTQKLEMHCPFLCVLFFQYIANHHCNHARTEQNTNKGRALQAIENILDIYKSIKFTINPYTNMPETWM